MALFITASGKQSISISGDVFVLPGVIMWNDNLAPLLDSLPSGFVNRTFLRIDGTVLSSGGISVALFANASDVSDIVVVGITGAVHAEPISAGHVAPIFAGISMSGPASKVVNDGQISGGNGIRLDQGLFSSIENQGSITGIGGPAIRCVSSNSVEIVNGGMILGFTGIELVNSYAQVMNSGSIICSNSLGFAIDAAAGNGSTFIRNTGLIEAPQIAIRGGLTGEIVVNRGDILGDVTLGGSNDDFQGRYGTLTGILYGGDGNDLLQSGLQDDSVQGDAGSDKLRGNAGDDLLYGGIGTDVLRGDEGDDVLYGGSGRDDFVFARRAGDDRVADFANGQDQIDVRAFHLADFAAVSALAENRPGGLLLNLTSFGGGTVILSGMTLALFDAGDVIL